MEYESDEERKNRNNEMQLENKMPIAGELFRSIDNMPKEMDDNIDNMPGERYVETPYFPQFRF